MSHFLNTKLSAEYFDISKNSLYLLTENDKKRRSIQTVLFNIINVIVNVISPVLPYLTAEFSEYSSFHENYMGIYKKGWINNNEEWANRDLTNLFNNIFDIRSKVLQIKEKLSSNSSIDRFDECNINFNSGKRNIIK